jgi:hypothetical protein
MEWLTILIASTFSGLIGVGISELYHNKNEKRRYKVALIEELMGNRYDLQGSKFTEALNKVFIVFYDSPEVVKALKDFHEIILSNGKTTELANQKLLDLFKAMCKNVSINPAPLTDNYFLQAYNIKR